MKTRTRQKPNINHKNGGNSGRLDVGAHRTPAMVRLYGHDVGRMVDDLLRAVVESAEQFALIAGEHVLQSRVCEALDGHSQALFERASALRALKAMIES